MCEGLQWHKKGTYAWLRLACHQTHSHSEYPPKTSKIKCHDSNHVGQKPGTHFPECVARVPVSLWGLRVCSLDVAEPFATVRNRPHPSATVRIRPQPFPRLLYGRAYGKFCRRGRLWRLQTSRCFVSRGRRGTSWHSDVFCNASKVVLCGRRNTFATFSEDALQFSWQAQHFGRVHRHFAWQAQRFRCVSCCVFCKSHWQGCVKRRQGADSVAGVAFCEMWWKLTEAWQETSIFEVSKKTRRTTSILVLQSVKIGESLARNASFACFAAPTCLVSSLWFSCGVAVSMGEAAKPLLFEGFQTGCHVVLRGRRGTLWHSNLFDITCQTFVWLAQQMQQCTPHSTLYTPHSTFHNLHSTLHTLHSTTLYTLHTPRFPLYTPHTTLYTPHSTLYTPYSTLDTLHSTLHTLQFTLLTLHFTLHTLHFALYTPAPHFTLHTPHFTLHTLHFTLYTLHSTLYTPHFTLHTPRFPLYTPHTTLYTPHSTLYTPHSTLYTLHFTLYTPHSTLSTPHSTLYTLDSTLRTLQFTFLTPHSTLPTPHFTLHTPHSTL